MTIEIRMPSFSSTMESGKVVRWLVEEGAEVRRGEVLAEIETDKAVAEIEAPSAGKLTRILAPAGDDDVPVNAPLAELAASGKSGQRESASRNEPSSGSASAPASTAAAPRAADSPARQRSGESKSVRASPAARHLAKTAGIELSDVAGTGPAGRITRQDVRSHTEKTEQTTGEPSEPAAAAARETTLRQAIARAMVASKTTVPHFYAETEVLVDALTAAKERAASESSKPRITLTAFLVLAAARALRDLPQVNSRWEEDGVVRQDACDIGVAVAVDAGVVVPVIRAADTLSVDQIASRLTELGTAARNDSLRQADLGRASLTVSNLGMFGIDRFYPVINPPEPLIIGFGRARRVPYVVGDLLGIRTVMTCSLAVDHRVIDGALAGKFAATLREYLEQPDRLTAENMR